MLCMPMVNQTFFVMIVDLRIFNTFDEKYCISGTKKAFGRFSLIFGFCTLEFVTLSPAPWPAVLDVMAKILL